MACPIRYSRLGYVALQVSDLAASRDFYSRLVGLDVAHDGPSEVHLRCSDKPYDIILRQGDKTGLLRAGFELESRANLDTAFQHLDARGYAPRWSDTGRCATMRYAAGFLIRNPDTGLEVEFFADQATATTPYHPRVTDIVRLGHLVMNVRSYADAHRFWVDDLGFMVSDHVPGKIAFLRCYPNPLHHSLALIEGPEDGFNHVNFMVTDIDDIGRAMNRFRKADVPIVFGPGRHVPSTSIFIYFLDPDGLTVEYSFGMEEIAAEGGRGPRNLEPKPETLDSWGSVPDPRFGSSGAILRG